MYDIHLQIAENTPAGRLIGQVAQTQHVTPDEAAQQLITSHATEEESPMALISRVRAEKARRKSGSWPAPAPDGNADQLIGFLADAPEVAQAIRTLAHERREQTYGY